MPMHDWTLATAGTYQDFHLSWVAAMRDSLNAGILPPDLFAMAEQIIGGPAPDVVTLRDWPDAPAARPTPQGDLLPGGVATLPEPVAPPATEFSLAAATSYVRKKSQIVIKHELGHVISVIELVSPGNKHSKVEMERLVKKSAALIHEGINLLVIDPFPPSPRDPEGIANLIWHEIDVTSSLPFSADRPLVATAFQSNPAPIAHINRFSVGDPIPPMPVFLIQDRYVTLPLEQAYQKVWSALPGPIRRVFEA